MAKRRFRTSPAEKTPEEMTPEERRDARRRDRLRRKAGRPVARSRWRLAAILGIPSAIIAAIVIVLLANPFGVVQPPCLTFSAIDTAQSGTPAFPPHNTTDFSQTWCPNAPLEFHMHPLVRIVIEGTVVTLPNSIGRNASYAGGYECDLPVHTHPPSPPDYPNGVLHVESPWDYEYNLSTFFSVWSQSYSGVFVNQSHPNQPVVYQTGDLLGFSADATHAVEQFVDNSPSSAGPGLGLNTLDYAPDPYPACLGERYGTGHVILLTYVSTTTGAAHGLVAPGVTTGPADPGLPLLLADSPLPHPAEQAGQRAALERLHAASLDWLVLKPG